MRRFLVVAISARDVLSPRRLEIAVDQQADEVSDILDGFTRLRAKASRGRCSRVTR
jgi:hypothetical protein